jgi:hypothetical protein
MKAANTIIIAVIIIIVKNGDTRAEILVMRREDEKEKLGERTNRKNQIMSKYQYYGKGK